MRKRIHTPAVWCRARGGLWLFIKRRADRVELMLNVVLNLGSHKMRTVIRKWVSFSHHCGDASGSS